MSRLYLKKHLNIWKKALKITDLKMFSRSLIYLDLKILPLKENNNYKSNYN